MRKLREEKINKGKREEETPVGWRVETMKVMKELWGKGGGWDV